MESRWVDIGFKMHVREWAGEKRPFVLVHGLASNSLTWNQVGHLLAAAGHRVLAIDQRGHGLSDKPEEGYDFETVTADLARLLEVEGLERPYLIGQSWGGNVMLEMGARYPGLAMAYGYVDGGTIDFQARPEATWERISQELKPPDFIGTPMAVMAERLRSWQTDWSDEGITGTMHNFETLPDGTVRPWLTLERHMKILRALWEQRPPELYPQVEEPVLIAVADDGRGEWRPDKRAQVKAAEMGLNQVQIHWMRHTAHDIHVHRPQTLVNHFFAAMEEGFWEK